MESRDLEGDQPTPPRHAKPGSSMTEVIEVALTGVFDAMEREDISAIGRLLAQEAERFPELAQNSS
jgi:hypothetical protein